MSYPFVLPHDLAGARARRIVTGALRFNRLARAALERGELAGRSLREFVAASDLPPDYVDGLLLPALATIATCSTHDALNYPADVVAGYIAGGLVRQSVRRAVHGADDVAARLVAGIGRVVCSAGVQAVTCEAGGATVHHARGAERFDHAVLATQANQALALWPGATGEERAALAGFRYQRLQVVMHHDTALMPARRADWSPVNAWVNAASDRPEATIWVNAVQPALRHAAPVFQTVAAQRVPRSGSVIATASFERPVVDAASVAALAALQRLQSRPGRRVWLCGSYAQTGVPLLESAVRSAHDVALAIDATTTGQAVSAGADPLATTASSH